MKDDYNKERWGQCVNMLMNKESQSVETEERYPNQAMTQFIGDEERGEREREREREGGGERERALK